MKRVFYLIFFFLYSAMYLRAQYDDPYQYYPMATGNYWYYSSGPDYYTSEKVYADSTDSLGNRYYWISPKYSGDPPTYGIDINHFFIITPKSLYREYYYKLDATVGEQWWVSRWDQSDTTIGTYCKVTDIYDGSYLGVETRLKRYTFYIRIKENNIYYDYYDTYAILAYGLGVIYRDNDANYPDVLQGAIIDGKTIGNPVGVDELVNIELPTDFELFQNYPNPFNPSTTIKFSLPQSGRAQLYLFNTVGENIVNLFDSDLNAGTHQITVDLSNYQLGSGVYFYTLVYNNQRKGKKMIYLK